MSFWNSVSYSSNPTQYKPGSWRIPVEQQELSYQSDQRNSETDDSSKYLNRAFVNDFYGQQTNYPPWNSEPDNNRLIVTFSKPASLNWLLNGRSQLEERMKLRERQLMRTIESSALLEILRGTILAPVATLLIKLHAPGHWRSCERCCGFLETYCCLQSGYLDEFEEVDGPYVMNVLSANSY